MQVGNTEFIGYSIHKFTDVQFYGYYSDYDWVVFCQLFGTMMDLPNGFPMFAFDIQQQIEEYKIDKEQLLKEIPQVNCHNALHDSIWNYNAYKWIQNKINNVNNKVFSFFYCHCGGCYWLRCSECFGGK